MLCYFYIMILSKWPYVHIAISWSIIKVMNSIIVIDRLFQISWINWWLYENWRRRNISIIFDLFFGRSLAIEESVDLIICLFIRLFLEYQFSVFVNLDVRQTFCSIVIASLFEFFIAAINLDQIWLKLLVIFNVLDSFLLVLLKLWQNWAPESIVWMLVFKEHCHYSFLILGFESCNIFSCLSDFNFCIYLVENTHTQQCQQQCSKIHKI